MKGTDKYKKVVIEITTYKQKKCYKISKDMSREQVADYPEKKQCRDIKSSKLICAMCLNSTKCDNNHDNDDHSEKKMPKPCICCPVCQNILTNKSRHGNHCKKSSNSKKDISTLNDDTRNIIDTISAQPDVALGLNLLNEVLTVFKSNKKVEAKTESSKKLVVLKDAAVLTEHSSHYVKPRLTVSKMFYVSIEEEFSSQDGKFTIVNSTQPENIVKPDCGLDLTKQKSSSIPQMKMEELKNSLKDKTKSKDTIEEVNRMFATVKRNVRTTVDDTNRPFVRHGPRVLPVVRTPNQKENKHRDDDSERKASHHRDQCCQFCQTNYFMSSGDSQAKDDCCHQRVKQWNRQACTNCMHTLCCHQENEKTNICQACRDSQKKSVKNSEN